ncbi:MAG: phosphoglycerate dehydrogenase [Flavobacteriales bacterium]|nr:phosphoglycerate dehydrogenase [Flavobacteriales bacterium]
MPYPLKVKCSAFSLNRDERLRAYVLEYFPHAVFGSTEENPPQEELLRFVADAEALIVGRERVDETFLKACPRLKVISKYGVGLDNIDEEACRKRNIPVLHTSGVNRNCVAELTLGFILAALHNICFSDRLIKSGLWQKEGGHDLAGKTVGIVGLGNVGSRLAELLFPFGVRLLVCDILDKSKELKRWPGSQQVPLEQLLRESDVVSLHVPLTPATRYMISKRELQWMKPQAVLVNTARGSVVHGQDLLEHLEKGFLSAVCLDVYEEEPALHHPLAKHPRTICTPHIGGSSAEARWAMGTAAVDQLRRYLEENPLF